MLGSVPESSKQGLCPKELVKGRCILQSEFNSCPTFLYGFQEGKKEIKATGKCAKSRTNGRPAAHTLGSLAVPCGAGLG